MEKYSIGIDFGTLSARAVLVNVKNGKILSESEFIYPHGVIEESMPDEHFYQRDFHYNTLRITWMH